MMKTITMMGKFKDKYRIESTRLKGYDYSKPGVYFITLCTYTMDCIFGNIINGKMHLNQFGLIVQREWLKSEKIRKEIKLDVYQIMPNHLHAVVWIMNMDKHKNCNDNLNRMDDLNRRRRDQRPLVSTYQPNQPLKKCEPEKTTGKTMPRMQPRSLSSLMAGFESSVTSKINKLRKTPGDPVWQDNYNDHIIRNDTELNRIRNYIRNNPKNWDKD